jgi:AraC-like DNA-binding protein
MHRDTMTHGFDAMTSGRGRSAPEPMTGTVSVGYLAGVLAFAGQCGLARGALLHDLALDEAALACSDARLPLATLRALFDRAAARLDDPAFALRFGVGVPCAQLTLASALAAARPAATSGPTASTEPPLTLRDALDGLNRYAALGLDFGPLAPAVRYRFVDDARGVWLDDQRPAHGAFAWPALTESVFARFATGIRRRGGEAIVRALEVTHAAPAAATHREAYTRVFRVPVRFDAPRNALCLDPAFLERPLEPLPAPVQAVLHPHAEALLARLPRETTWRGRVMAQLQAHLHSHLHAQGHRGSPAGGGAALGVICRALAVSRQTLHRRLRREGTTFAALHDQARRDAADAMLQTGGLTLEAIATRVGFSEAAAFSRAYKRWTGLRPGDVRRTG